MTASPTYTSPFIEIVSDPSAVHVLPSADADAVIVLPLRCSFSQYGAAASGPPVWTVAPPSSGRRWKATPFSAYTSTNAWAADGWSEARIMTPAFVQASARCSVVTRATMTPSPVRRR